MIIIHLNKSVNVIQRYVMTFLGHETILILLRKGFSIIV